MKPSSPALEKLKKLRASVLAEQKAKTEKALATDVDFEIMPSSFAEGIDREPPVAVSSQSEPPIIESPTLENPPGEQTNKVAVLPTVPPKPAASRLPSTPVNLSLGSNVLSQLDAHTAAPSTWTQAQIIEELILNHVGEVYPEICYRGEIIAPANVFCIVDRFAFRPALRIRSALGEFKVTPREHNESLEKWRNTYRQRRDQDAEVKAREMCIYELQQQLEEYSGPSTSHSIYPEDFLVETCFG